MNFKKMSALTVLAFVGIFSLVSLVQAAGEVFSGKVYFKKATIYLDSGSSISAASGSTGTLGAAHISNRTRYVDLPASAFNLSATGVVPAATGTPKMVTINAATAIQWIQGDNDTKVSTTFKVPADYYSGQTFKCMVSLGAASTDSTIGWEIFVNKTGQAFDSSATAQTAAAVTNSTTVMTDVSLATATDTFTAGDQVTFNVWRHAGTGTSATLSLYGCHLAYTADM
jgi:hypothetical protein